MDRDSRFMIPRPLEPYLFTKLASFFPRNSSKFAKNIRVPSPNRDVYKIILLIDKKQEEIHSIHDRHVVNLTDLLNGIIGLWKDGYQILQGIWKDGYQILQGIWNKGESELKKAIERMIWAAIKPYLIGAAEVGLGLAIFWVMFGYLSRRDEEEEEEWRPILVGSESIVEIMVAKVSKGGSVWIGVRTIFSNWKWISLSVIVGGLGYLGYGHRQRRVQIARRVPIHQSMPSLFNVLDARNPSIVHGKRAAV